jgi:hypothetical protein
MPDGQYQAVIADNTEYLQCFVEKGTRDVADRSHPPSEKPLPGFWHVGGG